MKRLFEMMEKLHAPRVKAGMLVLVLALLLLAGATSVKAVTFIVDSTADAVDDNPGDGLCDDGSGSCTLRAAVMEANALGGLDEIFLSDETYILTIPGVDNFAADGDLDIREDLNIFGTGASSTIIDAGGMTRVFHLVDDDDLTQIEVEIHDLTMMSSLAGNAGGALRNVAESLLLVGVSVESNSAPRGGGIYNGPLGVMEIRRSAIHSNIATGDPGEERGGGIYNAGSLYLNNVTVSNNEAGDLGGGIFNDSELTAVFVTIADNDAPIGGGIHQAVGVDTDFYGSIIAGNTSDDCAGVFINSLGANISTSTCNLTNPTDFPNTDPLIGPLEDNGGETLTHELLDGSPAIELADNEIICFGFGIDQRGVVRPIDGDLDETALCDAGAFEFEPAVDDGNSGGGCSVAAGGSPAGSLPLYLFLPVFVMIMRLVRRKREQY
jgi:CSLREA domain-containing protein